MCRGDVRGAGVTLSVLGCQRQRVYEGMWFRWGWPLHFIYKYLFTIMSCYAASGRYTTEAEGNKRWPNTASCPA
jgi:hypothetical protein